MEWWGLSGFHGLQPFYVFFNTVHFGILPVFASLLGQHRGSGDGRQRGGNRRPGQGGIGRRVAVKPLVFNGRELFFVFDTGRVVLTAEGAAGLVALFLGRGDLAVKTAEQANKRFKVLEVSFRVLRASEFLEKNLREACGGGLEADFGELRGIVAAEEIQKLILVEAILEDMFLGEAPFEVTASGPV